METTTKTNKTGKKKGEPLFRQNPNVDEVTRICISQILEQFRASNDEGIFFFLFSSPFHAQKTQLSRRKDYDFCITISIREIWVLIIYLFIFCSVQV